MLMPEITSCFILYPARYPAISDLAFADAILVDRFLLSQPQPIIFILPPGHTTARVTALKFSPFPEPNMSSNRQVIRIKEKMAKDPIYAKRIRNDWAKRKRRSRQAVPRAPNSKPTPREYSKEEQLYWAID